MATETKQRLEDVMARECLAVRVRMLNRVVTNIYDEAARSLGVRSSQINILVVAAKLGLARPADVCEILHLDPSTLSRNVERMKAKGWLEVVEDDDLRAQPFRLTAKGKRLLQRARGQWEQAQANVKELLGADVVDAIHVATDRINSRPPKD